MTNNATRRSRFVTFLVILSLVVVSFSGPLARGQQPAPRPARAAAQSRPRLVLLIVVDQFRYDYLERFGDLFKANGLNRLMRDGASWVDTNYDHMPTYTAPGHATLMTGAYPAETGIIANDWPDRETGKKGSSVSDESERVIGGVEKEPSSPHRLRASTLGDELRLATTDRAKVIGISLKARSAILPAGRHANAAYWFSAQSGKMVSSSYYHFENEKLPNWVADFKDSTKGCGETWKRLLPDVDSKPDVRYSKYAGKEDNPEWEVPHNTNAFPHEIICSADPDREFYEQFVYSPFSNDMLVEFTKQAIVNERLGQDRGQGNYPDVLTISFSANDYVGHRYGPYSWEVMDVTLRVDQQIGTLLDFVDKNVGLKNAIVIFTADHGVAPIPEHATKLDLISEGRGRVKNADVLAKIRAGLSVRYNPQGKSPDPSADYIMKDGLMNGNLYFNFKALERDGVKPEEIEEVGCQAALTVPGIARCFTRAQLLRGAVSLTDPIERRVLHGFYPSRSGDLIVVQEPFNYLSEGKDRDPATHGSPYSYDTHVPLIIMGAGFTPDRYFQAAAPADIAPTLAAVLGVQTPSNSVGRILIEALRQ
jgi:predicted AlkP superfamily pyrophosphatase or phosphodiesterase